MTVCILNQARHTQLIKEVRQTGARIKLIEEGEISGCLSAIIGEKTDIYMGYGYAPESTLVAAAINCLGGYFEGKISLIVTSTNQLNQVIKSLESLEGICFGLMREKESVKPLKDLHH